jgi:hypothetical protein
LKAFAFEDRRENKDAHDLVYCLEHGEDAVGSFREALQSKHGTVVAAALTILRRRFCDDTPDGGYLREGNVAVAKFEIEGDDSDRDIREQRALRQRRINDAIERFLTALGSGSK